MAELRRATIGSTTAVAGAGLGLALVFGLLVETGRQEGESCTTGLYPGLYADLLVPLHLLAFAVLCVGLAILAGALGHSRRAAAGAVALAAAYVCVCLAYPPAFGPYAIAAVVASIPVSVALAIGTALQVRAARGEPPELRWRRFARVSWTAQWAALVVLLPAAYTYAWVNGAGVFCF